MITSRSSTKSSSVGPSPPCEPSCARADDAHIHSSVVRSRLASRIVVDTRARSPASSVRRRSIRNRHRSRALSLSLSRRLAVSPSRRLHRTSRRLRFALDISSASRVLRASRRRVSRPFFGSRAKRARDRRMGVLRTRRRASRRRARRHRLERASSRAFSRLSPRVRAPRARDDAGDGGDDHTDRVVVVVASSRVERDGGWTRTRRGAGPGRRVARGETGVANRVERHA